MNKFIRVTAVLLFLVYLIITNTNADIQSKDDRSKISSDKGALIIDEGSFFVETKAYPLELLLIAPNGKRIGFVQKEKKEIAEIPRSEYRNKIKSGLDEVPDSPAWKELDLMNPEMGKYVLNLIGIKEDIYFIDIRAAFANEESSVKSIYGIINKGDIHQIEINYSSKTATIKRVANLKLLEEELKLAIENKYLNNQALGSSLNKQLKIFKKTLDNKEPNKNILKQFIEQLETEKEKYNNLTKKEKRWSVQLKVLEILSTDADCILGDLK